jgi:hypothetical protein
VRTTKNNYRNQHYKLFDGTINKIPTKAANCINGFYRGNNVIGKVINPKTQLGVWGFLTFAVGAIIRDNMLKHTNLTVGCQLEDVESEILEPIEPTYRRHP